MPAWFTNGDSKKKGDSKLYEYDWWIHDIFVYCCCMYGDCIVMETVLLMFLFIAFLIVICD